jgi:hypothetical protein
MYYQNFNEKNRRVWLHKTLESLPQGARFFDAGAGELQNQPLCKQLSYVFQDFYQYDGIGNAESLQTGEWDIRQE